MIVQWIPNLRLPVSYLGGLFAFLAFVTVSQATSPESRFDIAPFALPRSASGEFFFEEPRDIERVEVIFNGAVPERIGLSYLQNTWPERRVEMERPFENPCRFGWFPIDDWFNTEWKSGLIEVVNSDSLTASIVFQPLTSEFSDLKDYDVRFRRTLGIRVEIEDPGTIQRVAIHTSSEKVESRVRVSLDAGQATVGETLRLSGYNSDIEEIESLSGVIVHDQEIRMTKGPSRIFRFTASHMAPHRFLTNDEGHVLFDFGNEAFTISLDSLEKEGPIWFEDLGVFICSDDNPVDFETYRESVEKVRTIADQVLSHSEQSLQGARDGQPAPHRVGYPMGRKYARQRFWVEPNGDILLRGWDLNRVVASDTPRFHNAETGRLFFGLDRWIVEGWSSDPEPMLASNLKLRQGDLRLEQKVFVTGLRPRMDEDQPALDDTMIGMVRFQFRNLGDQVLRAEIPVGHSGQGGTTGDPLSIHDSLLYSEWDKSEVVRARFETTMNPHLDGQHLIFSKDLQPGASCELILKVPFITLASEDELNQLAGLDFEFCYEETRESWNRSQAGASIQTPEPILDSVHAAHLSHVFLSDIPMPDNPYLVNTSVGTSVYGNFTNESCMIVHDLDERGLHEEARRRLELWIKYQGTVGTLGNFTDHQGVYFGAGGYEHGQSYNQHHGWVLWCLAEHYFFTGDGEWLQKISDSLIEGMEWVFRQRRETMKPLAHSRGWEFGFLPAGALEDVEDYFYWLSTNALIWRGVDHAAKALADIGHPQAERLQQEGDAYREDLIRGFETMRRHTPLQRLKNGRWVPIYPSRLYSRGRDVGWIREVLEGSVYLLLSGLYPVDGKEAQWILDDFQDNRYIEPPQGYPVLDPQVGWFDQGGLSIQPNLLAGLLPYLDRDEPEIFLWMFFNCWAACYREEINGMVEHPYPFLGFSNKAHYKPSDEANATSWLRYMFVYQKAGTLYLGRAIPRDWFSQEKPLGVQSVSTHFGEVSVTYHPHPSIGKIEATVDLNLRKEPAKLLLRFRHPQGLEIKSVRVDGRAFDRFDAVKGDVDLTGMNGKIKVGVDF